MPFHRKSCRIPRPICKGYFCASPKGQGAFASGDGSPFQRLYDTANRIKHTSNYVNPDNLRYTDIVPLWLSNSGFHTYDLAVSYSEAAEVLSEISENADGLQITIVLIWARCQTR